MPLNDVTRVEGTLYKSVPFIRFEYVTITFGAANTTVEVIHSLSPKVPDEVDYEMVRADRACNIYNDQSGLRKAWTVNTIYLKCDTANAVVQLRLSLRRS